MKNIDSIPIIVEEITKRNMCGIIIVDFISMDTENEIDQVYMYMISSLTRDSRKSSVTMSSDSIMTIIRLRIGSELVGTNGMLNQENKRLFLCYVFYKTFFMKRIGVKELSINDYVLKKHNIKKTQFKNLLSGIDIKYSKDTHSGELIWKDSDKKILNKVIIN